MKAIQIALLLAGFTSITAVNSLVAPLIGILMIALAVAIDMTTKLGED